MTLRTRRARLAILLVASWAMPALAQPARAPDPDNPKVLTLDPAAAPVPALKYRLLPSSADLTPGDAAPIYLRIRYQTPDGPWDEIEANSEKWRALPPDRFPAAEARAFVDRFRKQIEQIEFGARRKTCDWNYTLPEQRTEVIYLALPDAQGMRRWIRLLDLKARVEIAEKNYDRAIRTIETGCTFSRHIAEGTFIINGLIGLAGDFVMLDRCEELIARPGAPNLYWALTVLPRPLIDFRGLIENEQKLCENMLPELTEAGTDRPRSAAEWSALLSRLHARMNKWYRTFPDDTRMKALASWDLARLRAESLPSAREYLKSSRRLADEELAGMSEDQMVALFLAGRYRELWDDLFKASYLPPREALPQLAAAEKRMLAAKSGPLHFFVSMFPNIEGVIRSVQRADRRLAALRVIEAIRLYAAAHDGKLPESLDRITEVPVPEDPATGEPFLYRAADDSATLHVPRAGLPGPLPSYRITIRR